MNNVHYLTEHEVLIIHALIIDSSGGSHGIRDINLFKSIIEKPKLLLQGKEIYGSVYIKAAVYFESIAQFHVFVDGNKRSAIGATARFLYKNGYEITVKEGDLEPFVIKAVTEKWNIDTISRWFEENTATLR